MPIHKSLNKSILLRKPRWENTLACCFLILAAGSWSFRNRFVSSAIGRERAIEVARDTIVRKLATMSYGGVRIVTNAPSDWAVVSVGIEREQHVVELWVVDTNGGSKSYSVRLNRDLKKVVDPYQTEKGEF